MLKYGIRSLLYRNLLLEGKNLSKFLWVFISLRKLEVSISDFYSYEFFLQVSH